MKINWKRAAFSNEQKTYAVGVFIGSGLEFLLPSRTAWSWLIFVLIVIGTMALCNAVFGDD